MFRCDHGFVSVVLRGPPIWTSYLLWWLLVFSRTTSPPLSPPGSNKLLSISWLIEVLAKLVLVF
jgi:hypothetical protein